MTASIVVNTYNRAACLERLLPSLEHLAPDPFEVVVVNGPSTDETESVLAQYGNRVRVVRCPSANLSQSRNIGIAAAAGDVIVFIDDDALPGDALWLRRLVAAFDDDPTGRLGAAGGPALHADTDWTEFAGGWTSDYGEQRFTDDPPAGLGAGRWYRRTVGNNSAFRRAALVAIGGFDEHFPYYLDEADVCLRLVRAGYHVKYLPDAPVRHFPAASPIGPPFIRNRRLIARSDTYYCVKNGADPLPRRVFETLRRAPRKHFVRELPGLVRDGRIGRSDLWQIRWQWLKGVVQGLHLGLSADRATKLTAGEPPPFVPFGRPSREAVLDIALLSRRIPPDPHAGGVGRYTFDLARGLHERGHRVTVFTESEIPRRHHALGFDIVGVRPATLPGAFRETPVLAQNLAYAEGVLSAVRARGRFDVVHASNWGLEALGLAQAGDVPLVLMLVTPLERVMDAERWDTTLDLSANIELDQWTIDRASRVCAPSAAVLASYSRRSRWAGRAVHAVPLGTVPAAPRARRPSPRRRLLFVGRHERRKGIHVLLEVFPSLLQRHPDWQCDLVGNNQLPAGPGLTFESRFRAEHQGAPWLDRVVFHGAVPDIDLAPLYADADLFVAPSLYESFGLIYLEAMQFGVPVVATRTGGVPDVVRDEQDGLLVAPGDARALEAALDRLMSDAALRLQFGATAAEAVRTSRNHRAMAGRMTAEYRAAIAAHLERRGDRDQVSAVATADGSVAERALAALDTCPSTRGLAVSHRASAALERGDRVAAAELIAEALALTGNPDYYTLAVELALADGDLDRAADYAVRGFASTKDDSETRVVFAAVLSLAKGSDRFPTEWVNWRREQGRELPARFLAAGLSAVRTSRDGTAVVLLEASRDGAGDDRRLLAQVHYHLGSALKRRGRLVEARACFISALVPRDFALLPPALQSALHFHMGDLELSAGRPGPAIAHLEACLSANAAHARARARLDEAIVAAQAA